jgi:hypothetical protein
LKQPWLERERNQKELNSHANIPFTLTTLYTAHFLGRQHYRLYTIGHIPSLKVLDLSRITPAERDKSRRLAQSAAGAALESDVQQEAQRTFTPGEGQSAAESFQTLFTADQKEQLRQMVANAKSPQEIEQIEASVQKGIFPSHLLPKRMPPDSNGDDSSRKRPAEETNGAENTKKART